MRVSRRLEQRQLALLGCRRTAEARATATLELVGFERFEDGRRAADDRRRQSCESRDLDAVAAVRTSRHDFVQEDDFVAELTRGHVLVDDAGKPVGEIGQLVIVRGEDRLRPCTVVRRQVFGYGPRQAQAIERGGAATDFVEDDEAAVRGRVQNGGRLLHLDHERRLAACDVVGRADARKDAVHDRELRALRRHERPGLRHQREQGDLAQIGRLAAHVRPGEDDDLRRLGVEVHVVRHERAGHMALDNRVPGVDGMELVAVVQERLREVARRGGISQRGQHVERGNRAGGVEQSWRLGRHLRTQPFEQVELARGEALVGAEDLLLVLLERGRHEPLAAGHGLLADVVGRHRAEIRFRDLDVVAEHAVVADFERRDAGACTFGLFHRGDGFAAAAADGADLVELGVDAVANQAAVSRDSRRFVDERRCNAIADISELVDFRRKTAGERRLEIRDDAAHAWQQAQRLGERRQIARAGNAHRHARGETLEIVDAAQGIAQLAAFGGAECEVLDRVEPVLDARQRHEWPHQPLAHEAPPHGRDRAVDLVEERALAPAVHALDDVEMAQRHRIDQHRVGRHAHRDVADVRELRPLRVGQIREHGPGGGDGGRRAVEPVADERGRVQLLAQHLGGAGDVERPRFDEGDANLGDVFDEPRHVDAVCRQQFARPDQRQLRGERVVAFGAGELGSGEIPGGHVETGQPPRLPAGARRRHGRQERRLARLEVTSIREGARRHDARDLAFDDALGLLRVLDLIADGHAVALAHEPREVAVHGVPRQAAHRDRRTVRVLRARGERELEHARRRQRVLVEHLVEVAHPEEDDRVPVLPLGVEVLPHGRRDGRRRRGWGRWRC